MKNFLFLRHEKTFAANRCASDGPCGAVRLDRLGRAVPLLPDESSAHEQNRFDFFGAAPLFRPM